MRKLSCEYQQHKQNSKNSTEEIALVFARMVQQFWKMTNSGMIWKNIYLEKRWNVVLEWWIYFQKIDWYRRKGASEISRKVDNLKASVCDTQLRHTDHVVVRDDRDFHLTLGELRLFAHRRLQAGQTSEGSFSAVSAKNQDCRAV